MTLFQDEVHPSLNHLLSEVIRIISRSLPDVRTDELRNFINLHRGIPEFERLSLSLILFAEGEHLEVPQDAGRI